MEKALSNKLPTSSVARLLDRSAVARALSPTAPPEQVPDPIQPEPVANGRCTAGSAVIKREFVLTPQAEEALTRLVQVYRNATGTRLSNSHVLRAMLRGVAW